MQVKIKNVGDYLLVNHFDDKIYNAIISSAKDILLVNVGIENALSGYLAFLKEDLEVIESAPQTDEHYNNENGSLYLFAQQHELNAWEFDIIKRIVRCRKKGQFRDDLEKTIRVIELYLKEVEL